MANTYHQIHIQAIFAVQNRYSLIKKDWEEELYKYITGIIQNHNHKLLQINGMPDHLHILIGMRPTQSIFDLMKLIKAESSGLVNRKKIIKTKFSWQEGYGAFSYSKSQVPKVIRYIQMQEEHHKKKTFKEEYLDFLKAFEVEYDEKYVFHEII